LKRILPYPLLFVSLLMFWLLLNGFTPAQLLLGAIIALIACLIMTALQPQKNHIRSIPTMLRLFATMSYDILQSNITVASIILSRKRKRRPGFVVIQLDLENRTALAVLACIITATPGTAWVDYNAARHELTIHVLDLDDAQAWRDTIKGRYEQPLIKIFGAADIVEEEKSA